MAGLGRQKRPDVAEMGQRPFVSAGPAGTLAGSKHFEPIGRDGTSAVTLCDSMTSAARSCAAPAACDLCDQRRSVVCRRRHWS